MPTAVVEDMQHCLALVASQPQAAVASLEVLHKLLANLLAAPQVCGRHSACACLCGGQDLLRGGWGGEEKEGMSGRRVV